MLVLFTQRGIFMNIEGLLQHKELTPITLVAGHSGQTNAIRSVTMMDAPDIIPYLR